MKYTVKLNQNNTLAVEENSEIHSISNLNFDKPSWNFDSDNQTFTLNLNRRKFEGVLLKLDVASKKAWFKLDGHLFETQIEDEYDQLVKSLGFGAGANTIIKDLKSPMPGVVVDIKVKVGESVITGQNLVVLEAMKMENLLKSPIDGVIKEILVNKSDTVEKNKILLVFES